MKRCLFLMTLCVLCFCTAQAQLTVYSNGKIGVATSVEPVSMLAIGEGADGFDFSAFGSQRGVLGYSKGEYLGWSYGVYGRANTATASFYCGTAGLAKLATPQSSSRTYGIMGLAGNATDGWNYGVFGALEGSKNGAGVYGTIGDYGSNVGGRYAGYFNGATKVEGNLTVTGAISGVLLSSMSSAKQINAPVSYSEERASYADRLAGLSALCYMSVATSQQKAMAVSDTAVIPSDPGVVGGIEQVPGTLEKTDTGEVARVPVISERLTVDTVAAVKMPSAVERQAAERIHYGLDEDQLRAAFPELVYELEDGTVGVNYMELIPILVNTINELNARIETLEGNTVEGKRMLQATSVNTTEEERVALGQNTPNPFNSEAVIDVTIPQSVKSAFLVIYDLSGKQLDKRTLDRRGRFAMTIQASELYEGIFLYSLVTDGVVSGTKKMIISK